MEMNINFKKRPLILTSGILTAESFIMTLVLLADKSLLVKENNYLQTWNILQSLESDR